MAEKICNKCGAVMDASVNFCEKCGSQSFRQMNAPVKTEESNLIHKLFYWNHDGYHVFSKSKLFSIITFILFLTYIPFGGSAVSVIILGIIFSLIVLGVGFIIHKILKNDVKTRNALENNNFGFIEDLKHAIFYWQNRETGEYSPSITKIISVLVFFFFLILSMSISGPILLISSAVAAIFAIPVCIIGYVIYKFLNSKTEHKPVQHTKKPVIEKKKETPKIVPKTTEKPLLAADFSRYRTQLSDLKSEFDIKEEHLRELIEKRFEPPQMTYNKFIAAVDKCDVLFNNQIDVINTMMDLSSEDSPKLDAEIESKIDVLNSIIDKIDDLTNELVLNIGKTKSNDTDLKNAFEDMEELIRDVKDYE